MLVLLPNRADNGRILIVSTISFNSGYVAKMKDKLCRVMYNAADPGDSKAK